MFYCGYSTQYQTEFRLWQNARLRMHAIGADSGVSSPEYKYLGQVTGTSTLMYSHTSREATRYAPLRHMRISSRGCLSSCHLEARLTSPTRLLDTDMKQNQTDSGKLCVMMSQIRAEQRFSLTENVRRQSFTSVNDGGWRHSTLCTQWQKRKAK